MQWTLLSSIVCTVLSVTLTAAGAAPAKQAPARKDAPAKKDDAKNKPINAKCPVMDEAIDPKVTTVHEKKLIGFCCESCIDDFRKEPAKYLKKIAAEKKEPAKKDGAKDTTKKEVPKKEAAAVNAFCPVHKENAVDPTVSTDYEGKKIGFCCEDCLKKFDTDPETYAAKLK